MLTMLAGRSGSAEEGAAALPSGLVADTNIPIQSDHSRLIFETATYRNPCQ